MFGFSSKNKLPNSIELEEAGLLSAIWILACNDENPIMTYESIRYRLNLPKTYDLQSLIKKRSELFRLGIPSRKLDEWKKEMLSGKSIPSWINEIKDNKAREEVINSLSPNDVFRSQFRAKKENTKSPVELINWGLEHIDRLRKAKVEEKEISWKWLKEGVIPVLSISVALAAIVASSCIQGISINSQEELKKYELDSQEKLKKYEVSFNQRNEGYASIMKSFELVFKSIEAGNKNDFQTNLEQLESSYYKIKPFLTVEAQSRFSRKLTDYKKYMNELYIQSSSKHFPIKDQITYEEFKYYFEDTLYRDLFERSDYVNTPVTSTTK